MNMKLLAFSAIFLVSSVQCYADGNFMIKNYVWHPNMMKLKDHKDNLQLRGVPAILSPAERPEKGHNTQPGENVIIWSGSNGSAYITYEYVNYSGNTTGICKMEVRDYNSGGQAEYYCYGSGDVTCTCGLHGGVFYVGTK